MRGENYSCLEVAFNTDDITEHSLKTFFRSIKVTSKRMKAVNFFASSRIFMCPGRRAYKITGAYKFTDLRAILKIW